MSSYQVQRAPEHRVSWPGVLAAALVACAVMAFSMPSFARVDVVVDGAPEVLPSGSTVSDLIDRGLVRAPAGDLVDEQGFVVREGGGAPPEVIRNGGVASRDSVLVQGDRIESEPGTDVPEAVVTTMTPIPIPLENVGTGPLVALESPGAVGVAEQRVGEISGQVYESTVISPPAAMVLRHYAPAASAKVVALTFDDGPWPKQTEQVLDILKAEGVHASFFMLGKQVKKYPDIAKKVAEQGNLVGNHSWGHVYLKDVSESVAHAEIFKAQNEIEKATGVTPKWYRPAGGIVSPPVWAEARKAKVRLITWTVDPADYKAKYTGSIVADVVHATKPGSIVLLHDGGGDRAHTIEALPRIIRKLKAEGYTFVTLDELVK